MKSGKKRIRRITKRRIRREREYIIIISVNAKCVIFGVFVGAVRFRKRKESGNPEPGVWRWSKQKERSTQNIPV